MLALLTRHPKETPPVTTTDSQTDAPVLMRFLTLGGATVQITKKQQAKFWSETDPTGIETSYPAVCLGCDWTGPDYTAISGSRSDANEHAASCRAMPKPTP